jgi:hypothetical protein
MDRAELADLAQQVLDAHRETLNVDRFVKISLEIVEGDFISLCTKDRKSALSWVIKLNPDRHRDLYDIHESIFEGLFSILLSDLDLPLDGEHRQEIKRGIISRLAISLSALFALDDEDYDDEDDFLEDDEDEEDFE